MYHNLDRVWVVHRVVIPKTEDLDKLPDFPDNVRCTDTAKDIVWGRPQMERHVLEHTICLTAAPQLKVFKKAGKLPQKKGNYNCEG